MDLKIARQSIWLFLNDIYPGSYTDIFSVGAGFVGLLKNIIKQKALFGS